MNSHYWDKHNAYYKKNALKGSIENKGLFSYIIEFCFTNSYLTIADVGCACGALYHIIKDDKKNYFGFDLSDTNIKTAQTIFTKGPEFTTLDITNEDLPGMYDIVFSSEMLSHIPLKYHQIVIKRLVKASKKLCLFSLKYTNLSPIETYFIQDKLEALYIYPNFRSVLGMIKEALTDHKFIVYKSPKMNNKGFKKEGEYNKNSGNLTVYIEKYNNLT